MLMLRGSSNKTAPNRRLTRNDGTSQPVPKALCSNVYELVPVADGRFQGTLFKCYLQVNAGTAINATKVGLDVIA